MYTVFAATRRRRQSTVAIAALSTTAALVLTLIPSHSGPGLVAAINCPPPNPSLAAGSNPSDC